MIIKTLFLMLVGVAAILLPQCGAMAQMPLAEQRFEASKRAFAQGRGFRSRRCQGSLSSTETIEGQNRKARAISRTRPGAAREGCRHNTR